MILLTAGSSALPGWFRKPTGAEDDPVSQQPASNSDAGLDEGKSTTTTGGGSDNEPVVVWEAANRMEAQIVQGRLESEGIPAVIHGESLGTIYGLTTGGLAAARVLVPGLLAAKARDILYGETDEAHLMPNDIQDSEDSPCDDSG